MPRLKLPPLAFIAIVGLSACAAPAASGLPTDGSPSRGTPSASPAAAAIEVTLADFTITPSEIRATAGTVAIEVTSQGPTPHNLTIRDSAGEVVAAIDDLSRDESATLTAELAAGEYEIFCSLAGHESLGMLGTLVVEQP